MSISLFASGTQTAVISTEHFLSSPNVAGVYTLHVDTVNMVAGDIIELRVYQIVLTGGTARQAYFSAFYGAPPSYDTIKISVPISNDLTDTNSLRFSLTQTAGTGRNFPWKVLQHS